MTCHLLRATPWIAVLGLTACSGVQHAPPAADAANAATVVVGTGDRNISVLKLQFNAKRCYQGETDVTSASDAQPLRIESGAPTFFTTRYRRGDTTCTVVLSFTPEAGARYVIGADYAGKILVPGSCSAGVSQRTPDGKWQPVAVERWTMRPASPVCVRPARASS